MRHRRHARRRYFRNPSKDVNQIRNLEAELARNMVSLATYLRITVYLKAHLPYNIPAALHKKLTAKKMEEHLDIFEQSGVIPPELGYVIFDYLVKHPKTDIIDPIFIVTMDDPPSGGEYKYWRPMGAVGVGSVAYQPWATSKHMELLQSYNLTGPEREVVAYHVRGPMFDESPEIEGFEPLLAQIEELATLKSITFHPHTQEIPLCIDLLNEYLAGDILISSSDVWLKRVEKSIPGRKKAPKKKTKAPKKKKTKAPKKKALKKKAKTGTKTDVKLGETLSAWRKKHKISKTKLAEDLGISVYSLAKFEKGFPVLTDEQLEKLFDIIN